MPLDTETLRRLRKEQKLTQEQMATKCGFSSQQSYQAIESGNASNVTLSTLDAMAKALGVQPSDLLESREQMDVRRQKGRRVLDRLRAEIATSPRFLAEIFGEDYMAKLLEQASKSNSKRKSKSRRSKKS